MPMTAPFDRWKYGDVVTALNNKKPKNYEILKCYVKDHDHYRNGEEWVGPGTASRTGKIADQFAPEDVIDEALSNIANAFAEPQVSVVAIETNEEDRELTDMLARWWDHHRLQEKLQDRHRTAAWAGYAALRAWIPTRFLIEDGAGGFRIRETNDPEKALSYIHISAPEPSCGAVLVDPGTQDICAVYLDDEVTWDSNGNKTTVKRAELVFLDPEREDDQTADTIIKILYSDPSKAPVSTRLRLNGNLLTAEMQVKQIVTDPVLRTQRQVNLLTTLVTRIAETAAFRERYLHNAKPQGTRIPYEDGDTLANGAFIEKDDDGRLWAVIPQERTLGANTTTELVGLPQYDEKGDQKGYVEPKVTIVDPADPKPYLDAADSGRRRIMRMVGQGHLGGTSNMEMSGIAYEQARAVFEKDLNRRRVAEEGMLRNFFTGVLALVGAITNRDLVSKFRVLVDQRIDAGPRSPDLVRLDLESYEGGVISLETAMARVGVEDISAERRRIQSGPKYILDVLERALKINLRAAEALGDFGLPTNVVNNLPEEPEPAPNGQ